MDISQLPTIVGQTIDTIASKLQVPAEKLLEVMVAGTRWDGAISLIESIALAIFAVMCFMKAEKVKPEDENRYDPISNKANWRIGGCILAVLALWGLELGIQQLFIPEYHLLKSILKF